MVNQCQKQPRADERQSSEKDKQYCTDHNIATIITTTTTTSTTSSTSLPTSSTTRTTATSTTNVVGDLRNTTTVLRPGTTAELSWQQKFHADEVVILGLIMGLWLLAVLAFLRKWSTIRILQPMEPRYRHAPKNLDSVRVVKRTQDSVIYKNYSRKMSITMVAREKRRLQKIHTIPILKDMPLLSAIEMENSPTEEKVTHLSAMP